MMYVVQVYNSECGSQPTFTRVVPNKNEALHAYNTMISTINRWAQKGKQQVCWVTLAATEDTGTRLSEKILFEELIMTS